MERSQSVRGDSFFYIKFDVLNLLSNIMKKIYLFLFSLFICNIGSPDKPGGLSIQLCKSEKKEFYIRYSS